MLLWITLTLALIALAGWRYGADSRDGLDRNPFAPAGSSAPERPLAPAAACRWARAHTPAADLAAVARAARCALHRIRGVPNEPVHGDAAWRRP
jgi:hypothetical protein